MKLLPKIALSLHRSIDSWLCCCSSGVEHFLGKEEVVSSILINSSKESDKLIISQCGKDRFTMLSHHHIIELSQN